MPSSSVVSPVFGLSSCNLLPVRLFISDKKLEHPIADVFYGFIHFRLEFELFSTGEAFHFEEDVGANLLHSSSAVLPIFGLSLCNLLLVRHFIMEKKSK